MSSFKSYERSASWLSDSKKKMRKTDLVRSVIEVGKDRFVSKWLVPHSSLSRIFGIARSSIRYVSKLDTRDEQDKQKLTDVHETHPWYGHRRIGWTLGWCMKKTRRLMEKYNIQALSKKRKSFTKTSDRNNADMHGTELNGSKIMNYLA